MRLVLLGIGFGALAMPAMAGVAYAFENDAMGWSVASDATGFTWDDTIGNNGLGAIRARDVGNGDYWYFSAPSEDLGDVSGLYGNSISYDILGITGNQSVGNGLADVVLTGSGISIGINFAVQPVNGQWVSVSTLVDETADWKIVDSFVGATLTGTDATMSDIQAVLGDLDGFYIRGEYTNGGDASAIDNVDFVPSPSALALLGMGGLMSARRRR